MVTASGKLAFFSSMLAMMFVAAYVPVGFLIPLTLIYMATGARYTFYAASIWTAVNGYGLWLTSNAIIQASLTTVIDLYAKGNSSVWMNHTELQIAINDLSVFLPLVAAAMIIAIPAILLAVAAVAAHFNKGLYRMLKTARSIHG